MERDETLMKNKEKKRTKHAEKNNDIKIKYYSSGKEESELPFAEDGGQGKKRKKKKSSKLRILFRCLLILFVVVLFVGIVSKGTFSLKSVSNWFQSAILGNTTGEGFPVPINGTTVDYKNFSSQDGNPVVLSDTSFTILNPSGGVVTNQQHGYGSPTLEQAKNRYLIYDLSGKEYKLLDNGGLLYEGKISNKILAGAVSDSGSYAIASDSTGYASEMTVYSKEYGKDNSQIFKWSSPTYRITALALNSDGTQAAAAGISAMSGTLKSAVYVFDLSQESPLAVVEYSDNLILSLSFADNGNILAVGDRQASVISPSGSSEDYSYGKNKLHAYDIDPSQGIALLLSPYEDGGDCILIGLNPSGKTVTDIAVGGKAISVDAGQQTYLVLTDTGASYRDISGKELFASGSSGDSVTGVLGRQCAYILGISEIRKLDFS